MKPVVKEKSVLAAFKELNRPVFTTSELVKITRKTPSTVVQTLNYLKDEGVIIKIYRGIWAQAGSDSLSPYVVVPFLFPRGYVSFLTALNLYGIIEQIPRVVMIASTMHSRVVKTAIGVYSVHRIAPSFFCGYNWYKNQGHFLIAEPEKALIDCLYISAYKKKQFGYFPELHFPPEFSFKRAEQWIKKIPRGQIRIYVQKKLNVLISQ